MTRIRFLPVALVVCILALFQTGRPQNSIQQLRERIERRRAEQAQYPTEKIVVGGINRTYILHTPPSYKQGTPLSLVFVFHGGRTPAQNMIRYTRMSEIADRENFIVVYPQGLNNQWNDGRKNAPPNDDIGFIRALIDHLELTRSIDTRRIYATGISNGGMFAQRVACELSRKIAAIASVAASMPEDFAAQCKPSAAISVLMIHGTNDPLVPYNGGSLAGSTDIGGRVWPVVGTIKFWAKQDRCTIQSITEMLPDKDPDDGTRVRHERYSPCLASTGVELYTIEGGGHTWPASNQYLPERFIGKTSKDIDGSEVIWQFFAKHSLK